VRLPAALRGAGAASGRRPGFWLLTGLVLGLHLLLADQVLENRVGWGSGDKPPPRIDVAFVRELVAAAPPAVAPPVPAAPAPARLPAVAAKAQPAASAALLADSAASAAADPPASAPVVVEPAVVVEPVPPVVVASAPAASAPDLAPAVAVAAPAVPAAPAAEAASQAPARPFDWPPSTRLTYRLTGYYRGPVEGSAAVEWLRQGTRYQVHLETSVGPVLSRHITSEGELTESGLSPRRFDGEQKVLFRAARRWSLRFGPDKITLVDGREVDALPGAQDEASQFVQLTWLFTTRPERLQVGKSVELPLAISRRLERWTYDIVAEQRLQFPFGEVPAFHVKPRREAAGGDLTPEIWVAPTLQYLPVRILIRDKGDNWVDLMLDKPPLQAAPVSAPAPEPRRDPAEARPPS